VPCWFLVESAALTLGDQSLADRRRLRLCWRLAIGIRDKLPRSEGLTARRPGLSIFLLPAVRILQRLWMSRKKLRAKLRVPVQRSGGSLQR
jgi:hypothetical protein